jgi:hypothetical protein
LVLVLVDLGSPHDDELFDYNQPAIEEHGPDAVLDEAHRIQLRKAAIAQVPAFAGLLPSELMVADDNLTVRVR